ncbi:MAG: HNH endonuclease [Kineosporiaceae bacterium]|nr:HNH endonuclease [Kineosporiaceae bacterium]
MGARFNPPPGWPTPPLGWRPTPNWVPDPAWPAPPEDWQFWVLDPVRPTPAPPAGGPADTAAGSATPAPQAAAVAVSPAPQVPQQRTEPPAPSATDEAAHPTIDLPVLPVPSEPPAPSGWPLGQDAHPAEDPARPRIGRTVLIGAAAAALVGSGAVAFWVGTRPEANTTGQVVGAPSRSQPASAVPSAASSPMASPVSPGVSPEVISPGAGSPSPSAPDRPAAPPETATAALATLATRGVQSTTPYVRSAFGTGWGDPDGNGCDTGNDVLARDLTKVRRGPDGCVVTGGTLLDRYVGRTVTARSLSGSVALDFVVPLADAWMGGAHAWTDQQRRDFLDDARNLQAVQTSTTQKKRSRDATGYIPSSVAYRCTYISRQIGLKYHYRLDVTEAERAVMSDVLATCPDQPLPQDLAQAPSTTP